VEKFDHAALNNEGISKLYLLDKGSLFFMANMCAREALSAHT
jgi:hypothetical protein